MNDWLSIPAKTRIELLREYKRNGISYTQAKKDFLNSYPDGGTVPKDNTNVNIPRPLLLDKINSQENPKFPFATAPTPKEVTISSYKPKTAELQKQVNKDYSREQLGNTINDVGTNALTMFTQFRKPTEEELVQGRGNWNERTPLLVNSLEQGLINEMLGESIIKSTNIVNPLGRYKSTKINSVDNPFKLPGEDRAIEKLRKEFTLKPTQNKDADIVLNSFKERIKTPEGKRRMEALGIKDEKKLENLIIKDDDTSYGYFTNGLMNNPYIGIHPELPGYIKPTIRHEIEHAVQASSPKKITEIDNILSELELIKSPKNVENIPKENIGKIDVSNFKQKLGNKQNATDYFSFGSEGKEKSSFVAEVQQYMLDKGYIKDVYENITPKKIKEVYMNGLFDAENPIRLFKIMKPTDKNYKLISEALNKMLVLSPAILGGQYISKNKIDNNQ